MADEDNDEEFEEAEPEDIDEEDLEALSEDEDLIDEDDDDVVVDEDEEIVEEDEEVPAKGTAKATKTAAATDEEEEEEEEEEILDADDVEASLDVILKDRIAVEDEEEDEEEEEEVPDPEERAEGATKVAPKRPDEFVCQSCFLVKHPSQLADSKKMLCRDCV
jgi:hypothetical protein